MAGDRKIRRYKCRANYVVRFSATLAPFLDFFGRAMT